MYEEFNEHEIEVWYENHKKEMLKTGNYQNPCDNCCGEDCACCSYGCGY